MRRLLDDLLDLSRISCNKIELRKENVPLATVVEAALTSMRSTIEARNHQLNVCLDGAAETAKVHADATRLEQVMVNLLNNAAKYTDPGGQIALSAWREGDDVLLRVEDNGEGIAADVLPNIFDPFVQADGSRCRATGGLGIGLALVQQLVQLHGGSVTAVSDGLGRGSRFTVRLPIAVKGRVEAPLPDPCAGEQSGPPRNVMLVEDQENLSRLTAMILEKLGHRVIAVAAAGPAAIKLALEHRPDLILMDIGLPGMDGFEVAQQMREYPQLDATTLVAVTGYGSEEDRRLAFKAGFDHHLVKPCSAESLAECLRLPLRSEQPAPPLAAGQPRP